ncbi:MAG: hypothetical protein DCF16_04560 [Alphaproteobacteria bacterium]|nr:MAG: hypothetical protein DCF16_04560 [Alphaproteobacteria bacterium]
MIEAHSSVTAVCALVLVLAGCNGPQRGVSSLCAGAASVGREILVPAGPIDRGQVRFQSEEGVGGVGHSSAFLIDATEVTNAQFGEFVAATNYLTTAERRSAQGVRNGAAVFDRTRNMWRLDPDADWRRPSGRGSGAEALDPVVAVSYDDALAYAQWRGRRLPTELEWERAARGDLPVQDNVEAERRGSGPNPWLANTWQGMFPLQDAAEDGYAGAAPVGCFPANQIGAYDMIGNVWEWTADWYSDAEAPATFEQARANDAEGIGKRLIKGGSHLCAPNFCARYRSGSRQPADPGLGMSHIGFRTVRSAPESRATDAPPPRS